MGSKPKKTVKKAPMKTSEITYNPVMSCNGGRHAYVCHEGKSHHYDTTTDEFMQAIIDAGYQRFVADLAKTSGAAESWAYRLEELTEVSDRQAA